MHYVILRSWNVLRRNLLLQDSEKKRLSVPPVKRGLRFVPIAAGYAASTGCAPSAVGGLWVKAASQRNGSWDQGVGWV